MIANTTKISIIIPALNEAGTINQSTTAILNQNINDIEIIIVDGDANHSSLKSIRDKNIIPLTSLPGRGLQMNHGAGKAKGETLLFLHSDTILPENGLRYIIETMKDKNISAGAFDLTIDSVHPAFRIIEKMATFRSRITRIPFGDQAVFIRKDLFQQLGGFNELPIMEDLDLMRRVRKAGLKIRFLSPGVLTSARRWEKEGILYCTLRNWGILILYMIGVAPSRLTRYYAGISKKLR